MKSLERFSIFSISATAGDPGVGEVFRVLMHKKLLILSKFDEYLPRGKYGSSPDLILLEFLVEKPFVKIFSRCSSEMPRPVSDTLITSSSAPPAWAGMFSMFRVILFSTA